MSMTPVNLAPAVLVVAGGVALALGHSKVGWVLIGVPVVGGVLVILWAFVAAARAAQRPPDAGDG